MKKLIIAMAAVATVFAVEAKNCIYSSKKVPVCEKKVFGTLDYCREHYVLKQMEMVGKVQHEKYNVDSSLEQCSYVSKKTGKRCPHKAPKGSNLCLFCQAMNVANAQCDVVKMNWDAKQAAKKAAAKPGKKPEAE